MHRVIFFGLGAWFVVSGVLLIRLRLNRKSDREDGE